LRTIGIQKNQDGTADMSVLVESLKKLHSSLAQNNPANAMAYQDYVDAHIKQILKMMPHSSTT
jgi:hypothetical protein